MPEPLMTQDQKTRDAASPPQPEVTVDPEQRAARAQSAEVRRLGAQGVAPDRGEGGGGASGDDDGGRAPKSLDEVAKGVVLEPGMKGGAVKELQELLKVQVTGELDELTVEAIKDFQSQAGLSPVSGRVGPTTLAKLRERGGVTAEGAAQMAALLAVAEQDNRGASRGDCFQYVWRFIVKAGYGRIRNFNDVPDMKSDYARDFADYMNSGDNAKRWGLRRLSIASPYQAPRGSIVVVGPGTPGTRHAVAGDIAVARGDGSFINDGPNMSYGRPDRFHADGGTLLGAYVPDI